MLNWMGLWAVLAFGITGEPDWAPDVARAVARFTPQTTAFRQQIHANPELGNREFETAKLIAAHLTQLGLEVTTGVAHTGVVAVLKGGRSGPVVAVRADMDALPVTEATDLAFKSVVRTLYLGKEVGVSHACGHDLHVAIQLGVASVLASMRERIPGTVKFIFQPAEEGPPPGEKGGAALMIEEGVLGPPRPEAIFGLHMFAGLKVGELGYTPGAAMAAVDHFKVDIRGTQSHGAYPHLGVDPTIMAAQAIMAFQTIRSRSQSPLQPSVVSLGIISGGERFNIIPETVKLEGTVRTYDDELRNLVERRLHQILKGITLAYGGDYSLEYERGTPAVFNHKQLGERMLPTLDRVVGPSNVSLLEPVMGGEDFAFYAREIPGFFFRLGQVAPGTISGGHHTPSYRADDSSIPIGMRAMCNLVLDYLHQ